MLDKSSRDKALKDTYLKLLRTGVIDTRMTIKTMMNKLITAPAPSFFLAPETIRNYIYMYERNIFLRGKLASEMQRDLYQTFLKLTVKHPDFTKSAIIEMVAEEPAPRFYFSDVTANKIIFNKNS